MSGVEPMEGLNIVSPTWFELRNDDNVLGVKESDPVVFSNRQGKIHMVRTGGYGVYEMGPSKRV